MTIKNIPVGYKDSPLGIIPQDWEVKRFRDIGNFLRNNTLSRDKMSESEGCIQNIHYGDILIKYKEILKVSKTNIPWIVEDRKYSPLGDMLQNGDIVISDTAEDYTVGKATELMEINGAFVVAGLHTMPFRPLSDLFSPRFLGYYLNSMAYRFQLYALVQGIKVCSISKKAMSGTFLIVPPLAEQEKIAEILSTWDKAIDKQTQLIEKLELRKKGLMQQLLTGKKRLPGFTDEWKKVKLGEISKRVTRKNDTNCQNVVTISAQKGFVRQTDFFNKIVASKTTEQYYLVKRDEFCYNKSYSNGFPMGAIKRLVEFEEAVVTTLYICFVIESDIASIDFIEQYFSLGLLNNGLRKVANEGGRAHGLLNVTPYDFFDLKMFLPSLQEQTAIANILSSCDEEIRLAQDKLAAMKEQKKGLMQVLLTGKRRVNK